MNDVIRNIADGIVIAALIGFVALGVVILLAAVGAVLWMLWPWSGIFCGIVIAAGVAIGLLS